MLNYSLLTKRKIFKLLNMNFNYTIKRLIKKADQEQYLVNYTEAIRYNSPEFVTECEH